ncbi:MAG: pyridoxamine 5'-phosphate oxidase family protein [Dehalococcoidia bacterium]|nr:pyridoxamine 5'-phosphate oxidase family protein [Dehalococcoidia bacterium]
MAIIPEEVKKIIGEQHVGFIATVDKNGAPNVSPKGSLRAMDDETLTFSVVNSPHTHDNLKANKSVSVAVFDTQGRKGFQLKGKAEVIESGPTFDQAAQGLAKRYPQMPPVKCVVKIKVEEVYEQFSGT